MTLVRIQDAFHADVSSAGLWEQIPMTGIVLLLNAVSSMVTKRWGFFFSTESTICSDNLSGLSV